MKVTKRIYNSFINNFGDKIYLIIVMTILSLSFILSLFVYNYSDNIINELNNNIQPVAAIKSIYNDVKYHPSDSKVNDIKDYDHALDLINAHIEYIEYIKDKYQPLYISLNAYSYVTNNICGYSDENGYIYSDLMELKAFIEATKLFNGSSTAFLNNVITLASERNEIPSKVYFEDAEIIKGRSFTKDELENGKPVIILPGESLKYQKNSRAIQIGDYVSFSVLSNGYNGLNLDNGDFRNHKTYEFEVIGFIEGSSVRDNVLKAYIPEKLYMELIEESAKIISKENPYYFFLYSTFSKEDEIGKFSTSNIMSFEPTTLKLKSIKELEMLYQEINEYNQINGNIYEIESNLDEYKYLETNFMMLKTIVTYVIIFAFTLSIIIYSLIIINDIRKRNKEIGILIALGENKINVIIQFITEYFIAAITSLVLALIVSVPIKRYMMNIIFNSYNSNLLSNNYLNSNNVINEISNTLNLDFTNMLMIFILEMLIVIIAIIPLVILIYRHEPKKILDGK